MQHFKNWIKLHTYGMPVVGEPMVHFYAFNCAIRWYLRRCLTYVKAMQVYFSTFYVGVMQIGGCVRATRNKSADSDMPGCVLPLWHHYTNWSASVGVIIVFNQWDI